MSNFKADLTRFLECNNLPRTLLWKIMAVLVFSGVQAALSYRVRSWFARHGLGFLEVIGLRLDELIFHSAILRYYGVKIGPGLYMPHPFGIVIGGATIGKNFTIAQHCTVGGRKPAGAFGILPMDWRSVERIEIGDWVFMGAGSCVLGPVKIGDNVIIAANSVVIEDVPSNSMVAGVPAKVIKKLQ